MIKLDKFVPREYTIPFFEAMENSGGRYRNAIVIGPRRMGKDVLGWNYAIRWALRRTTSVLYLLPTYTQAKAVIWDAISNDGQRFLDWIPAELIKNINGSEMKITLTNNSIIQLRGADNFDRSIVGSNASLIIFSEFAVCDPRSYEFASPIVAANGGQMVFLSCVSPETLVIGSQGLQRIKNVSHERSEYSELNKSIWGLNGFNNAEQFYYGGQQRTLKIKLSSGYSIECTPIHPLWNGKEWVKAQDLSIGDQLPIQYGQDIWGDGLDISGFNYHKHGHSKDLNIDFTDPEFLYLLGLIHADGNYNVNQVCVTKRKDIEIIEFLRSFGFVTRRDGIHHELSSKEICALLEYLDFKHGDRNKAIPEKLMSCTKKQMKAFIQGVFDGDGCSASNPYKRGYVKLSSTCLEFMQDLQVILLNFGIASSMRYEGKAPNERDKVWGGIYNLEIYGYFAHVFYRDIGFRLDRKQRNWDNIPASNCEESGNIYPVDPHHLNDYDLSKRIVTNPHRISRRLLRKMHENIPHPYLESLLKEKLFYSPITEITISASDVFDFVIPETHSFFSNGFISHNTPRGRNFLWDLWNKALKWDDWYCLKLTVDDTKHLSPETMAREREKHSEEFIQQEYYTSFDRGIEGSFWAKYITSMLNDGRIGRVPYDSSLPVNTAWDLGFNDQTVIVLFQITKNNLVNVIDCYANTNQPIIHYIKWLKSQEYVYGKHWAPHDADNHDFGTGLTRTETARSLGISFETREIKGKLSSAVPRLSLVDGIEKVSSSFNRISIDQGKCYNLIKALESYHRVWDDDKKVYKQEPVHDINSDYADSFRYMCLVLDMHQQGMTEEDAHKGYNQAMFTNQQNLPSPFVDPHNNNRGFF